MVAMSLLGIDGASSTLKAIGKAFAIIEFDTSGKIRWANENFCNAMGYRLKEIKGRHHKMFVDPGAASSASYAKQWEKLAAGENMTGEFQRFGKGGKEIWIQACYMPVISATGRVTKIVKVASDITCEKLKAIGDAGKIAAIERAQAVIEFTPDGTIVSANQNFLTAVGYRLDEIVGQHHSIFVDPDYAKTSEYAQFWRQLSAGEFVTDEFARIGKGGKQIWIQASYNPILDPSGQTQRVVKFANDITDRVKAVEGLADGLARLAQGDLTNELASPFPLALEKLRTDYNDTVNSLRGMMSSMGEISDSIDCGAQEISTASDDLSGRNEKGAASLEETAAALQEVTSSIKKTASGAVNASATVEQARGDAERGGEVVDQAVDAMSKIEASSQEVSQIISVIDEIAFQTNLLALNAGVEAARAGDAGRGFAVVASEVRALAQRSASAAQDIRNLISTSTTQVEDGVRLVAETGQSLKRIVSNVVDINSVVTEIAESAQEQAISLQQVNDAVVQMDKFTQQNAAMSEETTAACRSLAVKSRELAQLMGRFNLGTAALRSKLGEAAPSTFDVSSSAA